MRVRQYHLLSITATQTKYYSVHNTLKLQRIYNSDNSMCREQAVKTECTYRRKGKEEFLCMDTGLKYDYLLNKIGIGLKPVYTNPEPTLQSLIYTKCTNTILFRNIYRYNDNTYVYINN